LYAGSYEALRHRLPRSGSSIHLAIQGVQLSETMRASSRIAKEAAVSDQIFAEPFVNLGGKQKYTVLVSIVAHSLIIATAIIVPVVATNSLVLPARLTIMAFPIQPPLPPSPPPPRIDTRQQPPVTTSTVPLVAPPAIIQEVPIQLALAPMHELDGVGVVPGGDYLAPPPPALVPAPVADQAPLPVGGVIKRPLKVRDATPTYPPIARTAHVEGIVIIEATIGPDGKVQDARVIRSANPLLNTAALDAVRQWEYTPTLLNGIPVAIVMTVTVDFRLR
jgi:protein TonB